MTWKRKKERKTEIWSLLNVVAKEWDVEQQGDPVERQEEHEDQEGVPRHFREHKLVIERHRGHFRIIQILHW